MFNPDLIEISKANIDIGEGESKTAKQIQLEISEREKRIKEMQQYTYKKLNRRNTDVK